MKLSNWDNKVFSFAPEGPMHGVQIVSVELYPAMVVPVRWYLVEIPHPDLHRL